MEANHSTDHRWSARLPLSLEVKVFDGGEPIAQGHTHNVGIGGMFIDTHHTLPLNSHIAVAFSVRNKGNVTHHRLPATVIWSSDEGAGLMFTDFSVDTVHTLREILYPEQ
ncbi:MAG: PilZ domain-containing protein [Gammaproteobacteria bacterium]